ncbi:vanadium-dependent haloperoxidase [Saccharothrix isguenensis]
MSTDTRRRRLRSTLTPVALAAALTASVFTPVAGAEGGTVPAGDNVIIQWDQALMDAIRVGKLGPPHIARASGIVHTCTYDAWAAYDGTATGTRYGSQLRRPLAERTLANKSKAISYAAYLAVKDIYPASKPAFDQLMVKLGYDPSTVPGGPTSPAAIGTKACKAVLDYRHHDGSNQLGDLNGGAPYSDYTGWVPRNDPMDIFAFDPATVRDPNSYQPLTHPNRDGSTSTDGFLGAHWGKVKLLSVQGLPASWQDTAQKAILEGLRRTKTPGPAPYGSEKYVRQSQELLDISANLTEKQKVIAEYWADGVGTSWPSGHWMELAQVVSRRDNNSLDKDAKLFFAMGNAQADAAVAAWYVKRYYDYVRPITSVRHLFQNQQVAAWGGPNSGTVQQDGAAWRPYQEDAFPTPPFAEYVSGHSAFSYAAAEVFRQFTGSNQFGHSVTIQPGAMAFEQNLPSSPITLSWPTFTEAAAQVGISRRYGGIHFEDGDLHGRALGSAIGQLTWKTAELYFSGRA